MWHLQYVLTFPHRAGDQALADLRVQVYYSVFDLDERYWVYNYNLFYRSVAPAALSVNQTQRNARGGYLPWPAWYTLQDVARRQFQPLI